VEAWRDASTLEGDERVRLDAWAEARSVERGARPSTRTEWLGVACEEVGRTHRSRPVREVVTALRARHGSEADELPDSVLNGVAQMTAAPY